MNTWKNLAQIKCKKCEEHQFAVFYRFEEDKPLHILMTFVCLSCGSSNEYETPKIEAKEA